PAPAPEVDLQDVARKMRPAFQLALLGLIKSQDQARNLERLARAAGQIEAAARTDAVRQIWWVVGGVLEALIDGGLDAGVTVKRLLGQADRQIKRLMAEGEEVVAADPPLDLLNNLLYYVARARSSGERVEAIRASFALSELLPGDDEVAAARESLSGPSIRLMQTVAAAIKEDLARVKDVLDIHVRTASEDASVLAPQLDMLKKIADTLGVLGLGELRGDVLNEIRQLGALVRGGEAVNEATLLSIAAALLQVEDSIDQQLVRMASPAASGADHPQGESADDEHREVTGAVLRECAVNLARVKDAISSALTQSSSPALLDEVPGLLRGITAALLMLGKERAVRVVERIGRVVRDRLRPGRTDLDPKQADRLADAIVSLEYYMETLAVGRGEPWYMLDNAESCLEVLLPVTPGKPVPAGATPEPEEAAEAAAVAASPAKPGAEPGDRLPVEPRMLTDDETRADPELLEVFIEEAKEELVTLGRHFPAWQANRADTESLVAVRRSFHTLKGSGRMVGAQLIGEFSWNVENLLNRLINGTLALNDDIVTFIGEAIGVLPQLVEQLELGIKPRADFRALMKQAQALAGGDVLAARQAREASRRPDSAATPAGEGLADEPEEPPVREPQMDPVLRDIFLKETRGHLQTVQSFLEQVEHAPAPPRPTDGLHRACHTLLGSARMAGVKSGEALAEPMERYVRGLMAAGAPVTPAGQQALAAAVAEIETLTAQLADDLPVEVDTAGVVAAFETPLAELNAAAAAAEAADSGQWQTITAPAPEIPAEAIETPDPELAAIFSEEAAEILEQADDLLDRWQPDDSAQVMELQRLLHTLKGGARMAGLIPMGDVAHEMESLLEQVASGQVPASPALLTLLQRCTDALHGMRDAVDAGLSPQVDAGLLRDLA
ncbi:MAG: Hpt domain-containing protein, partial [Gammaproteobacteria bacterium]|nr:Hpt domain-containing protein [Gammaproteobacteria bacterium]